MIKTSVFLTIVILMLSSCTKDNANKNTLDLFIWAGQSNALGRQGDAEGYPVDVDDVDHKIKFNWTHIDHEKSEGWTTMGPQTGLFPSGHFGPEVTFSRELLNAAYNPAIFKFTKGATSIFEHWQGPGDGGFYDDMIKELDMAILSLEDLGFTVNIKGFIWIQGESDSNSDASALAYSKNLSGIINGIRSATKNSSLPVILGVDEQFFDLTNHEQPAILNTHQRLALNDNNIKFTSMYNFPKADATHLTPSGIIAHGKNVFESYEALVSENTPASNCMLSSEGNTISVLTKKAWGQSFNTDCSGYLSLITFSAASVLNNTATFTLHHGAECSGDILYTETMSSITNGNNTITIPSEIYLDEEHTYFLRISSDTDIGWKVNYNQTNNVIGNLKTSINNENNESCNWSFHDFDLNFSIVLTE